MGNEGPTQWLGGGLKAVAKEVVRPLWRLLIERRLAVVEERLNQRMDLLYGILDRRLDEIGDRIDGLAPKPTEANQPSPTVSIS